MKLQEKVFECIEEFLTDEHDVDGNELKGEDRIIERGSRWEVEWIKNGWVKLCEITNNERYAWLELSVNCFDEYFKACE